MGRTRPHYSHYERRKIHREAGPDVHTSRSCPQRKLSWDTRACALQKAAEAFKLDGVVLKPYKCPHCRLWHLTSKR